MFLTALFIFVCAIHSMFVLRLIAGRLSSLWPRSIDRFLGENNGVSCSRFCDLLGTYTCCFSIHYFSIHYVHVGIYAILFSSSCICASPFLGLPQVVGLGGEGGLYQRGPVALLLPVQEQHRRRCQSSGTTREILCRVLLPPSPSSSCSRVANTRRARLHWGTWNEQTTRWPSS